MRTLYATAAVIVTAGPAFAHDVPGAHSSALAGLAHPLFGADHLLAMVAVGLLAALQRGAARWVLPASFVSAVGAGIALAASGATVPLVEPVILSSILGLAVLVAMAARPPVAAGSALLAVFGLAHGAAHGIEMGSASALPFALGVLGTTALLHTSGAKAGALLLRLGRSGSALRLLGAGLGVGALGMTLG